MSLKKKLLFTAAAAVLTVTSSVFAEIEIKPYGGAQYRLRGRIWTVSAEDSSATAFDHQDHIAWMVGLRAKIDEQISLQFQIGNDWIGGENVSWLGQNTVVGRGTASLNNYSPVNNMYVHLAYARWNPGYMYADVGVIPVVSNGSLDLLIRSLNNGSYNDAALFGWTPQTNNSMAAIRLGAPILKNEIKTAAELTMSIIDQRTAQYLMTKNNDMELAPDASKSNISSLFLMLNFPTVFGNLRITPEFAGVVNRNYNRVLEDGDHEILGGLAASYKVNSKIAVSLFGGYGNVSNDKSKVGAYGIAGARTGIQDSVFAPYNSVGILFGAGTIVKAGPGTFSFDVKYSSSYNDKTEATKINTMAHNIFALPTYTFNIHPNFVIIPKWWFNLTTYDKDRGGVKMKMENRPELVIGGSF